MGTVRIIKHEAIPGLGSFEVRFADDRESIYFYWDDIPSRRMRPETLDRETALEQAKGTAPLVFQGSIIFAVIASNIRWQWTPNGYLASMLAALRRCSYGRGQWPTSVAPEPH